MKKRARVSPVIKTAIFVSVIMFLIGFSYNKTNPSYGRIDSPASNSDANTKNNSSIIYPNITKQTGQYEPSASPTIGSTLGPNMP